MKQQITENEEFFFWGGGGGGGECPGVGSNPSTSTQNRYLNNTIRMKIKTKKTEI